MLPTFGVICFGEINVYTVGEKRNRCTEWICGLDQWFYWSKKKIFLSFCLNVASDFGKTKLLIPLYHVLMLRQSTAVIYYKRQGSNNCAAYASYIFEGMSDSADMCWNHVTAAQVWANWAWQDKKSREDANVQPQTSLSPARAQSAQYKLIPTPLLPNLASAAAWVHQNETTFTAYMYLKWPSHRAAFTCCRQCCTFCRARKCLFRACRVCLGV